MSSTWPGIDWRHGRSNVFLTKTLILKRVELGDVSPEKAEALQEWLSKSTDPTCTVGEVIEFGGTTRKLFAEATDGAATWDGKKQARPKCAQPLGASGPLSV